MKNITVPLAVTRKTYRPLWDLQFSNIETFDGKLSEGDSPVLQGNSSRYSAQIYQKVTYKGACKLIS